MNIYKKSAIIVGSTVVVISLVIIGVANRMANNKKMVEVEQTAQQTQVVSEQQVSQTSQQSEVSKEAPQEVSQSKGVGESASEVIISENAENKSDEVVTTTSPKQEVVNTFTSFSESDLLSLVPGVDIQEVMIIANKGVILLQDNKKEERQLMYALDMFTTAGDTLHYYVSQDVYNNVTVGDKLNVTYVKYTNDNNVEFPVIKSVAVVN